MTAVLLEYAHYSLGKIKELGFCRKDFVNGIFVFPHFGHERGFNQICINISEGAGQTRAYWQGILEPDDGRFEKGADEEPDFESGVILEN